MGCSDRSSPTDVPPFESLTGDPQIVMLVSSTVKELTAGSGLAFGDAGEHELKGIPDRWHLYREAGRVEVPDTRRVEAIDGIHIANQVFRPLEA